VPELFTPIGMGMNLTKNLKTMINATNVQLPKNVVDIGLYRNEAHPTTRNWG
jgi:hypothetical protein